MEVLVGKTYKHFKGHIVTVVAIAKHTETMEELVVYNHINTSDVWARPISMFTSLVDKEKYPEINQIYRFQLQED